MFEIKVTFYSIYCELATTKNYGKLSSHYPHVYKTKWWHLHGIYEKLKIIVNNNFLNLPRTFSKVAFFTRKTWAAKLQLNYHYYYNYYFKKTLWCNPRSRPSGVKIQLSMSKIVYSTGKLSWRFKQINFFFDKKKIQKQSRCFQYKIPEIFYYYYYYFIFYFYLICYSTVQQLQLLSQSIDAQTDYTPKHTCNSTTTTRGMPTVILQVLFKKEETNHFFKRRKTT